MAQYTLGQDGAEEFERARLALLEEVHDPYPVRQFDAIGVSAGWRCLDVGAGSATRLVAARVGDRGSVVSLDPDVRLLEGLASDRVQVRRHDAVSDSFPKERSILCMPAICSCICPHGWTCFLVCSPQCDP